MSRLRPQRAAADPLNIADPDTHILETRPLHRGNRIDVPDAARRVSSARSAARAAGHNPSPTVTLSLIPYLGHKAFWNDSPSGTWPMRLHATCVAFGGAGLLLLGVPGSGKSSLALRLMERGWSLVADDQVEITAAPDGLMAGAPAELAGMLEIRGLGVFAKLDHMPARLAAAARLRPASTIARLPEPSLWRAQGMELPEFPLDAADVAAPEKALWALRAATGQLRQISGAFES